MQIETPRLILREFVADDWHALAAHSRDPRHRRLYPEHEDVDQFVRDLVTMFVASQNESPRRKFQLAAISREDRRLIGTCGIRVNNPELREANIGYAFDPEVWGQGLATEAATAMLAFGFDELGMHRVWAECVADNVASTRVLTKLGMRQEARFREHQYYRDRWWDTLIFAILDHER
jgi:[ribosomal protein S5]-alanine N-acetyltransferase